MSQPQRYEALVLGSGAGGKLLAWHLASSGRRAAVVERKWIGGSCPNVNCLPSKNEVWSAKVADLIHHAARFGMVTGSLAIDMERVRQRKRDMVDDLIAMHLEKYQASGAELIMGAGRFVAPKTIEVSLNDGGTRLLTGEQVFLNLGTRATVPSIPGLAQAGPLTNIELLELDRLPEHLVVLGAAMSALNLPRRTGASGAGSPLSSTGLSSSVAKTRRSRRKSGASLLPKGLPSFLGQMCWESRGDRERVSNCACGWPGANAPSPAATY